MEYQLDLTAYRCPLPLLMTQKALKSLPAGATLIVTLPSDSTLNDFFLLEKQLPCHIELSSTSSYQQQLRIHLFTS